MATVALDQYLASVINSAQVEANEIALESGSDNFDLFKIYLENHHPSTRSYLEPFPLILYVVSGKVLVKLTTEAVELTAGNLLLLARNCRYEIKKQSQEAVLVKFKFTSNFDFFKLFKKYAQDGSKEAQYITQMENYLADEQILWLKNNPINRAAQISQSIINSYLDEELFTPSLIHSEIDLMLILSFRNRQIVNLPAQETSDKNVFSKANLDRYIDAHFTDITLAGAAAYFDFNPNYFSNLVKQKTGKSFVEHVDERRMQEARVLLAQPDLSLKEIIHRVGYSSKSFFYKKFSEYYGQTPAAMRQDIFREAKINLKLN